MPLLDPVLIFKGVRHEFLHLAIPTRSGFKTVSVSPIDGDTCGMHIDLDGLNTERSVVRVRVENKDALRISTYIMNQPLVDIVAQAATNKEKKDNETQH
jgi:hypothetical protein